MYICVITVDMGSIYVYMCNYCGCGGVSMYICV